MSVPLVVNGVTYNYPQPLDTNWGPTLTNWSTAVTNGMLQTGGSNAFQLLKSASSTPATIGNLRLARTDTIVWRNALGNGNLALSVDASDNLLFNGVAVGNPTVLTDSHILVGNVSNVPTDVAMSGDVHISNTGATTIQANAVTGSKIASGTITESNIAAGTLTDTSINASAAIAVSKLAAVTANKALQSDASGFVAASSVTSTELGYVAGASSNIQAQINAIVGAGSFVSGMGMPFFGSSVPSGWLLCDGSAVSRSIYSSLFSAIGTTYGPGDGVNTFNLPNGVNYTMVGQGGSIVASLGATAGAATHTISSAELPTHNHTITDSGHQHKRSKSTPSISVDNTGSTRVDVYGSPNADDGSSLTSVDTTGITINNAGSSTAMSLVQPSLGINWIIKT